MFQKRHNKAKLAHFARICFSYFYPTFWGNNDQIMIKNPHHHSVSFPIFWHFCISFRKNNDQFWSPNAITLCILHIVYCLNTARSFVQDLVVVAIQPKSCTIFFSIFCVIFHSCSHDRISPVKKLRDRVDEDAFSVYNIRRERRRFHVETI